MCCQVKEKEMNKNYFKKKDVIVMFVNLLMLFIVAAYIYFNIAETLKTILLDKNSLCEPKTSLKIDRPYSDKRYFDYDKTTNQNTNTRRTRSTNSVKSPNLCLFYLAQPNIDFEQNGILGPWILSNRSFSGDANIPLKLTSRRTLLEVIDEGLYLVNIQVYYLSSSKRNSYAVSKINADVNETLSVCSAAGAYGTEISCFTSIVEYFKTGESVLIRLREMSSTINLSRKASHTYLGFTKLL